MSLIGRSIFVFIIPFVFIWIGTLLANLLNNIIFEMVLAIIVFLGVLFYWLLPIMAIVAVESKLETVQKHETMKKIVKNNHELNRKFGHMYKEKDKNEIS